MKKKFFVIAFDQYGDTEWVDSEWDTYEEADKYSENMMESYIEEMTQEEARRKYGDDY